MCRIAAYLGPPAPLSTLLYGQPRSLEIQAYDPHEQHFGNVNVDGTGLVWWDDEPAPLRYVTDRPPWSDPNLPGLAPRLRSHLQLAAVRAATPGLPFGPQNVGPYTYGQIAVAHNGWIGGFFEHTRRPLMEELPDRLLARYGGSSDSELLLLHVVAALEADPGAGLSAAVAGAVARVVEVASAHGQPTSLTVVAADGDRLVALREAVGVPCNTLYVHRDHDAGGATVLASEPLTLDAGWELLPEHVPYAFTHDQVREVLPT